tara:strand:- start:220 stop:465 length:246 start_codon:yes stop_codon:yes gene_type:complete
MRNQKIEKHKSETYTRGDFEKYLKQQAEQVRWFDYDDEIAIRVEKSDYTDNKLLITVHLDGGEGDIIEEIRVDLKELIGWE